MSLLEWPQSHPMHQAQDSGAAPARTPDKKLLRQLNVGSV